MKPMPVRSPVNRPSASVVRPRALISRATFKDVINEVIKLRANGAGVDSMSSSVLPIAVIQAFPNSGLYRRPRVKTLQQPPPESPTSSIPKNPVSGIFCCGKDSSGPFTPRSFLDDPPAFPKLRTSTPLHGLLSNRGDPHRRRPGARRCVRHPVATGPPGWDGGPS